MAKSILILIGISFLIIPLNARHPTHSAVDTKTLTLKRKGPCDIAAIGNLLKLGLKTANLKAEVKQKELVDLLQNKKMSKELAENFSDRLMLNNKLTKNALQVLELLPPERLNSEHAQIVIPYLLRKADQLYPDKDFDSKIVAELIEEFDDVSLSGVAKIFQRAADVKAANPRVKDPLSEALDEMGFKGDLHSRIRSCLLLK